MALDFTLLKESQIWERGGMGSTWSGPYVFGKDPRLDVIKTYGPQTAPTDLAVLLGCNMIGSKEHPRTIDGELVCEWPTKSRGQHDAVMYVCVTGKSNGENLTFYAYNFAIRPVLTPEETAQITPDKIETGPHGIDIAEYGEYPQTVADKKTSDELERLFQSKSLSATGKQYTFNKKFYGFMMFDIKEPFFEPMPCTEYEMEGKKYIRVTGRPYSKQTTLSNEEEVESKKTYWVEVKPIEWLVDKTGTWVSKKCLFTGIPFDTKKKYDGNFEQTFMKQYLNTYFAKEIGPSEREVFLRGLKTRLAEASDLDQARADTKPAKTPERTELAARIRRTRRERDVIRSAAIKARESGDEKLFEAIVEIAKVPMARAEVVERKFHERQAARRAARTKPDRG